MMDDDEHKINMKYILWSRLRGNSTIYSKDRRLRDAITITNVPQGEVVVAQFVEQSLQTTEICDVNDDTRV